MVFNKKGFNKNDNPPIIQDALDAAKRLDEVTTVDEKENQSNLNLITKVAAPEAKEAKEVKEVSSVDAALIGDPTVSLDDKESIDNFVEAVAATVVKKQKKEVTDNAMGSQDPAIYEQPGKSNVVVTAPKDKKAYGGTSPLTERQREDLINRLRAHTATDADMARIDESMIFDLPFIKAADYSITQNFSPLPKDPSVRFRWVNCVNFIQGNMMKLMQDGFEVATIDDVNTDKTPIHSTMIKGTEIHNYDTVLMKISVLKLMSLYRRNMENSLWKLEGAASGKMGEAAAMSEFNNLVSNVEGGRAALQKARISSGGQEPVTFTHT